MRLRPLAIALTGSMMVVSAITGLVSAATSSSSPSVVSAAATSLPELVSATAGTPTSTTSGGATFQTTSVTFTFDAAVTTAAPVASDFHLVGFDANWRVDGSSAATDSGGKSVLVSFGTSTAPIGAQQIADTSMASVNDGAVTGSAGTNPDGSVPLGATQTLTPSAGKTAAPDLLSVGNFRSPPPTSADLTHTLVDFTFDQPAFAPTGGTGNAYLVTNDGSSPGKSTCTYNSGSGTSTLTMSCTNEDVSGTPGTTTLTQSQVARAYVDPRLVSADPQNATAGQSGPEGTVNPLESAAVGNAGATPTPYLKGLVYQPGVSVTTSDGATVQADQVEYEFDQPVTVGSANGTPNCGTGTPPATSPTGACFLLAKADGSEVWAADPNNDAPAISGNGPRTIPDSNNAPTIVLVTFPAGSLAGVVGGAVTNGAVKETASAASPNDGSWFPKAASGSVTRVPGTTNGPILIGIRTNPTATPATATYVFDQDLTAASPFSKANDFYLADSDGTKLQCQTATVASGQQPGSNNTVTCTSYKVQVTNGGTATDTQITQATEGYVDHNAVTASLPPETTTSNTARVTQNPETAVIITGPPVVTKVSPTSGSSDGGTQVTITGTNFTNATAVDFGSTPTTTFTVNSATSITATSPPHDIGAVDISVTTPQGTSQSNMADTYTYIEPSAAPAVVSGISPSHGPTAGGTQVTISGTGFGTATEVDFGSHAATFQVVSNKTINATAPPHAAGPVHVTVVTPNGRSQHTSADVYTYTRTTISATLHCRSPHKHVVKCKVKERPGFSGLKVVFKKRTHHQWKKWDVRRTNSRGNATLVKRHLRSGRRLEIKAVVHGNTRVRSAKAGPVRVRVK